MANIFDIARASGVSRSTVSRVINNQPNVKQEKIDAVHAAIEKLHYTPSAAARALAKRKTNTIGVVVKELSDTFYSELIKNIHYIADSLGYGALYCNRNSFTLTKINYLETFSQQVDGYIFIGEYTVTSEELNRLVKAGNKVITIGFDFEIEGVTTVTVDNYQAIVNLMNHLVHKGHRKIMHLSAEEKTVEFAQRIKGYQDVIKEKELSYEKVVYVDYDIESSYELGLNMADELLEKQITAVVCANDTMATGLMDGLITKGVKIPDDVAVVGFDDVAVRRITKNYLPMLTTVAQPHTKMAEYAVKKFVELVDHNEPPSEKVFQCAFIQRESC